MKFMAVDIKIAPKNPPIIVTFDAVLASEPAESIVSASSTEAACRGIMVDFRILSGILLPDESSNYPKLNWTNTLSASSP